VHTLCMPPECKSNLYQYRECSRIREQESSLRVAMTWMSKFVQLTHVDPFCWTVLMKYLHNLNLTRWSAADRVMWGIPTWGPLALFILNLKTCLAKQYLFPSTKSKLCIGDMEVKTLHSRPWYEEEGSGQVHNFGWLYSRLLCMGQTSVVGRRVLGIRILKSFVNQKPRCRVHSQLPQPVS
jgi:hypothetical protein